MYAVFSGWKFYVKEHQLLRKYLKESGAEETPFLRSTKREEALRAVVSLEAGSCYSSLIGSASEISLDEQPKHTILSGPARGQSTPQVELQITGSSIVGGGPGDEGEDELLEFSSGQLGD